MIKLSPRLLEVVDGLIGRGAANVAVNLGCSG